MIIIAIWGLTTFLSWSFQRTWFDDPVNLWMFTLITIVTMVYATLQTWARRDIRR